MARKTTRAAPDIIVGAGAEISTDALAAALYLPAGTEIRSAVTRPDRPGVVVLILAGPAVPDARAVRMVRTTTIGPAAPSRDVVVRFEPI